MPKTAFAKDFVRLVEEFNVATQRAIAALANGANSSIDSDVDVEGEDIFDASIDRLYVKVKKACEVMDKQSKELDAERQKMQAASAKKTDPNAKPVETEPVNEAMKEMLRPYKASAEKLEKSLEAFTLRVRSQLMGRKDLGDKFVRAAGVLFTDLKKFDAEIDKVISTQLKRKPRETKKKAQVIPSKFLADFKAIMKKYPLEGKDPKIDKAFDEAEDRLKRVDTNATFDKVTQLCETAQTTLKELMKQSGKTNPKLAGPLKDLIAAIEKYDNHMFLLGRNA